MRKVISGLLIVVLLASLVVGISVNLSIASEQKSQLHKEFKIQFLAGRSDSAEFALTHALSDSLTNIRRGSELPF